jgi:hypothetical protein
MGDFFKAISDGLSRFVLAWIVPSTVVLGVYLFLVLHPKPPSNNPLVSIALFALAALTSAVILANASLPLYRLLEGYTLPRALAAPMQRRHIRKCARLRRLVDLGPHNPAYLTIVEKLQYYPADRKDILPTGLGNALASMETYGRDRYGLDSQSFWYELQSVAPVNLRRDTEDGRAGVDFFICFFAYLFAFACACVGTSIAHHSAVPLAFAAGALLLMPAAYRAAVKNVIEWRASVQALVNVGRHDLATKLGMSMPETFSQERAMWENYVDFIAWGKEGGSLTFLNGYRARS